MDSMDFVIHLKSGTPEGEIMHPLIPPEEFTTTVQNRTRVLLMQSIERIVGRGEKPMMQIALRYVNGITIIESSIAPICFTDVPGVYSLRSEL